VQLAYSAEVVRISLGEASSSIQKDLAAIFTKIVKAQLLNDHPGKLKEGKRIFLL
jgi:hypothetical protein